MSVNRVILIGNLGKDPEVKTTPSGAVVATFSLATNEHYNDKHGVLNTQTEWHNIVAWGRIAEICREYLHKGKQIYITGKIQTRTYEDRDGNRRQRTEIVVDELQMLGRAEQSRTNCDSNNSPSSHFSRNLDDKIPF